MKIQEIVNPEAATSGSILNLAGTDDKPTIPMPQRPVELKLQEAKDQYVIEREGIYYLVWKLSVNDETGQNKTVDLLKVISEKQAYVYGLLQVEHCDSSIYDIAEEVIRNDMQRFMNEGAACLEGNNPIFSAHDGKLIWSNILGRSIQSDHYPSEVWTSGPWISNYFFIKRPDIVIPNFCCLLEQDVYPTVFEVWPGFSEDFIALLNEDETFDDIKEAFITKAKEVFNLKI